MMLKLMKLEFKKFRLKKDLIGVLIANLCIIGLAVFTGVVPDEELPFSSARDLMEFGAIMIRMTFIIYAAAIIAAIIIGEYSHKTVTLMYSYPIPRKKLMASKLIIVFLFTFITVIVSNVIFAFSMIIINPALPLISESITFAELASQLPGIFFSAVSSAGISLIALFFGMRKKSAVATIVSAVIVASLLNSNFGGDSFTLYSIVLIPILFCLMGIGIACLTCRNINKEDVVSQH